MKKLLAKIRKILHDRRTRQMLTRIVSVTAAIVVFITTYALVLPAITMESEANCGIEAHQHDDSCYEDKLICGEIESPGHHHSEGCYKVSKALVCEEQEHQHDDSCFDESGNLTCGQLEHTHDDTCYKESRELTCDIPESDGHQHSSACYERVLTCSKEIHTHSTACYDHASDSATSAPADFAAVATTELGSSGATVSASTEIETDSGESDAASSETSDAWAAEKNTEGNTEGGAASSATTNVSTTAATTAGSSSTAAAAANTATASTGNTAFDSAAAEDTYIPQLEPVIFEQLLTKDTDIYYYHAEEGQEAPESSADIADWKRVNDDTELTPADLLRVYLRYTIPAGTFNATNDIARYRLPSNLHLTDQQMETINTTVNGVANQYVSLDTLEITDTEKYNTYLGIEATEGTRKPSDNVDEYFADHPDLEGQEYINAVVRAENVFDDTTGEYAGQDLVFTFSPYTVQKNQHEYDADGQPTKAGQKVDGWLCFDLHMDQIDWSEPVVSATDDSAESTAKILFAAKDTALDISEISTSLRLVELNTIESEKDDIQEDQSRSADDSPDNDESKMTDPDTTEDSTSEEETSESDSADEATATADDKLESAVDVNAETYPPVSFEDTITVQAGTLSTDSASAAQNTPAETAITVSVIAEKETFPLGTTMQLGTVEDMETVASAVEGTVEGQTRGFHAVDISFYNSDGEEIEPLKPIKVSMTSEAIKQAVEEASTVPVVVHVEETAKKVDQEIQGAETNIGNDTNEDSSKEELAEFAGSTELTGSIVEVEQSTLNATLEQGGDRKAKDDTIVDTLTFEAGTFSVYAVVYTVDFHYEVNGKTYEFSIPGGGFVSLEHLVELLGICGDTANSTTNEENSESGESGTEETRKFVTDVDHVEFSSPELVWVGKAETDSTVGNLKEANGLECEYSADLTEEQILEINAQTVRAGDWALISMLPFDSEENLTVTMKNGDQFTIEVTDATSIPDSEASTIDVNKSYLIVYEAGGKYYILKNDGTVDATKTPGNSHNFEDLNSTYAWTFSHVFKEKDVDTNLDNNYYLIRPIDNKSKTLALNYETDNDNPLVQAGNNNTGVIPVSGGGFILQGYHNLANEGDPHRYIHLGFADGEFRGVDGPGVTVHIYVMDSLPAYDYTVQSADETRGTVTVQGGTQRTNTDGTHYYDAASNSDKKNAGTITAVPVDHKNPNAEWDKRNENKWLFDHWEQDGVPLDRQQYGRIINADDLPIPFNGSNLIAYFKQNPEYVVPEEEQVPTSFDDMTSWFNGLNDPNRKIPLDPDATDKTAEVYDYENRIYRVDIKSKANFETFAGDIDIGFSLDVSNSMKFPASLKIAKYKGNTLSDFSIYSINDNESSLDTNRGFSNPYYIIGDKNQTSTVFKLYYEPKDFTINGTKYYSGWYAQDAAFEYHALNKGTPRFFRVGKDEFKTSWVDSKTKYCLNKGDSASTTYPIYDHGDEDGKNRFDYLEECFEGASGDLEQIMHTLEIAGDESPDVYMAYNTFCKEKRSTSSGTRPDSDLQDGEYNAFFKAEERTVNMKKDAEGGTRPDLAFADALTWNWRSPNKYLILITDGAPQGGANTSYDGITTGDKNKDRVDWADSAADALKKGPDGVEGTDDDIKIISVGLGMKDVEEGRKLLYRIADVNPKTGDPMFYLVDDAADLRNVLRQIIRTLMEEAVVYADVTDTVNDAFYLVDKNTGFPLKAGDRIDIEGILTTDDSRVAGIVQPDGKTVKWLNRPIDQTNGWHGTVYVKAKEDIIGGNAVKTNGVAKIEATKYRVGGQDHSFNESLISSKLKSLQIPFESPRVNVNDLSFPSTGTEWTVYLGQSVDPKLQLKKLYEGIDVIEVVNKDGSLHYPISPNSISDERGAESRGEPATFKLADTVLDIIKADSSLSSKYIKDNDLNWEVFLEDILKDGGVTIPYHPYGIEGEDSNIVITLTKTVKGQEEQDLVEKSPHATTVAGNEVEKYVLTARYNPDYNHVLPVGQGGKYVDASSFHTGTYGTMYQGHAAGRETSTDTHVINVYKKTLDVLKTDTSSTPIHLSGAEFKLFVKDDENGSAVEGLTGKYRQVASAVSGVNGVAHLESQTEDLLTAGTTYYLMETKAPEKYQKDNTVYAVEVQVEEGKYSSGEWTYKEDSKVTRYTTGTPTQDPYNWNQGVRILANGKPVTVITSGASEGQTVEVTDGSYISNNSAISFRHTIKNKGNEITLTVNKTWENVDDKPDSVRFELYRVSEKGHQWGEPTITHSTCSKAGVEEYTCLVCGKKETHAIAATGHTPGSAQRENETAPSCIIPGGYDTVVRCKVCNAVISSIHTEIPAIGHDWGEWVVTTPAQPGIAGVETRVCNHDRTHIETRSIDPLPNKTSITYRTYRDWYGHGWLESTQTTSQKYDIGSSVTLSWKAYSRYSPVVYIGCSPVVSQYAYITPDYVNGYDFPNGTVRSVNRDYNWQTREYTYSFTVTVTKDMTLDIVSNSWDFYPPDNIPITQNGRNSVRTLKASGRSLKSVGLLGAGGTSSSESMSSEQLSTLLNGIKSKDEVSCKEQLNDDQIDQADHTYKELAGTYIITPDNEGRWTWTSNTLPKYNEYGSEYTYYVKEIDPSTGYETTYVGQTDGLHNGDTAVITNKILKGSLLITKIVKYNNRTANTDVEKAFVNGGYTFVVKKDGVEIEGSPFTITVSNGVSNSVLIPNLEEGEDYTIEETSSGNLTLKAVSGGSAVTNNIVTAVVTGGKLVEADLLDTAKAEFTNNYTAYKVTIVKVDTGDTAKLLGDAKFDLYDEDSVEGEEIKRIKAGAEPIRSNLTTASSGTDKGKVSLGPLTPGTYYLFETKAPEGYNLLEGPVTIRIYENMISLMQDSRTQEGVISQEKTELTVMNTAGYELPSTGGSGTHMLYLLGLVLAALAGAGLAVKHRGHWSRHAA